MARYVEAPELLPNAKKSAWKIVFDPANTDPELSRQRVIGMMPRGRPNKVPLEQLAEQLGAIRWHDREAVYLAMLDEEDQVFALYVIGIGGPNSSVADMTSALRALLLADPAGGALLVHNHPSGRQLPSPEDVLLTDRLSRAFSLHGYDLVDHLIFAEGGIFSFSEAGMLEDHGDL